MTNTAQKDALLRKGPQKADRRDLLLRVSSFSVASVLAVLAVTTVMPPIIADQSDRAVINAPVTLLTSPISGEVKHLEALTGQELRSGASVSTIVNERVDRATLVSLESKANEMRESVEATRQKSTSLKEYIEALDAEIARQKQQLDDHFVEQLAELKARIGAADAAVREKDDVVGRQTTLATRNIASPELIKAAKQQLAGAGHEKDAHLSLLNQKTSQLEALRRGVFVGPELTGLSTLSQRRMDLAFEAEQLQIKERELLAGLQTSQSILEAEQSRVSQLSEATVAAPFQGRVLTVGVSEGRHVLPGDTIASIVDCERSFVVAIFSYRRAQDLAVGTRVSIDGEAGLRYGRVAEILPRITDKADEGFAVPFPPTERREMYVLVEPEAAPDQDAAADPQDCSIGRWVTVSRGAGWVPSASVLWKGLGDFIAGVFEGPFGTANAGEVQPDEKIRTAFGKLGSTAR
ncbi:HlyD family efflux transporter periplasmic adaptor subunit [Terrihabitans rhizophilus]|uniref:HlyD family efflux transporter periplasmic adaptor subunit n=1 Tax=Terrihabitans rhizophilus TaxID=3092662 RepID=A0ABU4RPP9_9HYPH|nr:HlyD family efflux transporter periplasmic adaptor subunit [Terrihabitans sp. PJ23]MDX6806824.1 HlyD family efflux transporter periplasmic adaptor subunit [Terrihabitans sp. PJ23]